MTAVKPSNSLPGLSYLCMNASQCPSSSFDLLCLNDLLFSQRESSPTQNAFLLLVDVFHLTSIKKVKSGEEREERGCCALQFWLTVFIYFIFIYFIYMLKFVSPKKSAQLKMSKTCMLTTTTTLTIYLPACSLSLLFIYNF